MKEKSLKNYMKEDVKQDKKIVKELSKKKHSSHVRVKHHSSKKGY